MNNIFQSKVWEELKLKTGYQKSYWVDGILVLQKNLPFGYSMLYSPMVDEQQPTVYSLQFTDKIKEIAKAANAIFYRLELNIPSTVNRQPSTSSGFAKAFEEMQPEHTLILDLSKSEEEILAQMKQKGRYNIKIAEKSGVEIETPQGTCREQSRIGEALDSFYDLYSKTGKRHGISHRAKSYFASLLEILTKSGYARVYKASLQFTDHSSQTMDETVNRKQSTVNCPALAAAIMVYSGRTAIYMFGASSDEYRNLMAPYALHWKMIRDAKSEGYKYYDFFGIAPDDNPHHPWAGVSRFKHQFGGEQVDTIGSYDLILKPMQYQLFKIAEKIRR